MHVASEVKPRLKDLHNLITPLHAVRWREIGNHLGLQSGLLDIIDYDQQHKAEDCCNMVWEHWLDMDSNACWKKVLDAIDVILLPKRTLGSNTASYKHDISPEATNILQHLYKTDRYKTTEDDWPPYQPEHYASVALIHHKDKLATTKTVISVGIKMHGGEIASQNTFSAKQPQVASKQGASDANDYFKICHTTKDISEIFTPLVNSGEAPNMVLIEGAPGIGKTILSKEIAFRWANSELLIHKKVLVLMFLRDPNIQKISSFSDLAKFIACSHAHNQMVDSLTNYFENSAGEGMTIIFDGYDELPKELRQHSFVADLINRKYLPLCGLVITSRPTASAHLHKIVERRVEILGFAEEDRKEFIYHSLQDNQADVEKVLKYLENNPFINSLCYIPLNMTILICLFKEFIEVDGSGLPKNQTEMNNQFACMTVSRCIRKEGGSILSTDSLSRLPQPYKKQILQLSKLAFMFLRIDKIVFSLSDIKSECPKLLSAVENYNGLGLVKAVQYFNTAKNCEEISFNFLHFSLQEFLAAYYIASSSNSTQVHMLEEYFWDSRYLNTWIMYAGLTGGNSLVLKHFLSGNRFMWFSRLFGVQQLAHDMINDKIKCLHLFQCFLEAGNDIMCHKVGNFLHNNIIDLSKQPLLLKDLITLSFFLTRSSTKIWKILNLSNCFIGDSNFQTFVQLILETHPNALHIEIVNITNNFLTVDSLPAIHSLIHCLRIDKIILFENDIPNTIIAECFFRNGLMTTAPLFIINSEECVINPEQKVLPSKTNLEIYLSGCCLKEQIIKRFNSACKIYLWNTRFEIGMIRSVLDMRASLKISLIETELQDENINNLAQGLQIINSQFCATDDIDYILASERKLIVYKANYLHIFPSVILPQLSSIQLTFCEITAEIIDHFGKILVNSTKQWELVELIQCNINDEYWMELVHHLSCSTTKVYIKQLNLSNNHLTSSVIPGFLKLLQCCIIEQLNLSQNLISDVVLNEAIYSKILTDGDLANFNCKIPLIVTKNFPALNNEIDHCSVIYAINCQINKRIGKMFETQRVINRIVLFNNNIGESDIDIIESLIHSKYCVKMIMFEVGLQDVVAANVTKTLHQLQHDNYLFEAEYFIASETMLIASRITEKQFIKFAWQQNLMALFKVMPTQYKNNSGYLENVVFNKCNLYNMQLENIFDCILKDKGKIYLKVLDLSQSYLTITSLGSIVRVLRYCALDQLIISGMSNHMLCDAITSSILMELNLLNFDLRIPLIIINSEEHIQDATQQNLSITENIFVVNCEYNENIYSVFERILNCHNHQVSFRLFLINNSLQLCDADAITSTVLAASQVHISLFAFGVSDAVGINFMNKLKCTHNLAQNCISNSGILSNIDLTVISSTMLISRRDTQDDFIASGQKVHMSNQAFTSSYLNSLATLMQEESLKHLETIDISGCNISDEWFKAFCYTIVSNRLKKLDLSNNKLTNASATTIIKLLRSCVVEILIISYNFIKDEQLCFVIYSHILEGVLQLKNFAVSCPLVIINSKENLTNENHDMISSSLNYAYAFFVGCKFNESVKHIFKTILESQAELYRLILMDNNLQLKDVEMLLSIFNKWSPLEVYILEYGMKEDTASRLAKEIQKFLGDTDQVDKITKKIMYILHSKTQLLSNDAPTSLIVSALTSNSSIITLQVSSKSKRKVQVKRILPVILSSSKKWNMIDFSFCNIEERDFKVLSVICREYVQTKVSYMNMKRSMQVTQVNTLNFSHNYTSTSAFMYISQIASILRVQNMIISVKTPIPITTLCLKFLITAQSRDETELTNLHMVNGNDILVASCDSCIADMIYQKLASATTRTNCSVNSWKLSCAKSLEDQKLVTSVSLVDNNFDAHTLLHCIMAFSSPTVDMFVQEQNFKHENQIIDLKFHYSIKSCDEEFSTRQYSTVEKSLHSIMFQLPNSNRKQTNTFTGNMPMEFILNLANDKSISTQLRQFVISNTDISNKLACEIAKIISDNPKVEYIELSNNNLQEDGFMKIAKSFKVLKHLQSLNLNYNKISANVVEILSYIIENAKLCQLNMSHCNLGDHEMLTIVKSLDNTNTISLANIDFCSSTITDVAACFLSSALSNSPSLTHLNLSGCNLQEKGTELILSVLKLGSSIKRLDLNFNVISHNAASHIAQFKNVVEHLGLSNCKLQYSELHLLAKAFDGTLKSLSYNYICISDVIAKGIATLLMSSECFEHLELSHCAITEHSFATIMKALSQQEHLNYLDMRSTTFHIREIAYFTGILWFNSKLEYLDLSNCSLKQEFLIKICEVLAEHFLLKHFNLSHNKLTDECTVNINEVVISNLQLQHLSLHHNALTFNGVQNIVTTVIRTYDLRECICLQLSDNLLHSEEITYIKALMPKNGTVQLYL